MDDNSLTGDDIDELSLASVIAAHSVRGATISNIVAGGVASEDTDCNPASATAFTTCGSPTLASRGCDVLLIATAHWYTDFIGARGSCRLVKPGAILSDLVRVGENDSATDATHPNSAPFIGLEDSEESGSTTYSLECRESEADIAFDHTTIPAIMVNRRRPRPCGSRSQAKAGAVAAVRPRAHSTRPDRVPVH